MPLSQVSVPPSQVSVPLSLIMASRLEDKSVDDVCEWLEDRGYPESVLRSFRGNLNIV